MVVIRHIKALLQGLGITLKYFFTPKVTQQYPEEKRQPYRAYRGLHYFRPGEQGEERCVACGLCAAVCPNNCIFIESAESADKLSHPERNYAKLYSIGLERCVFCGYCEEACPKEAIALSRRYDMAAYGRSELFLTKDKLLAAGLKVDEDSVGGEVKKTGRRGLWGA